jgi:transposase-like protein
MKTSPIIVEEVRRLSQEEGLKDAEIADIIKYNRVTVQKIRKLHNIPTYNKEVRKDQSVVCPLCHNTYYIRRKEDPGICCPLCAIKIDKGE